MSSFEYFLMHKDKKLAVFSLDIIGFNISVSGFVLNKYCLDYLPLPIKLVLHCNNRYFECQSANTITINENGCLLFENWLNNRTVPADRIEFERYFNKSKNSLAMTLEMNAVSFTDDYWVKLVSSDLDWNTVKLYGNKRTDKFEVIEQNRRHNKNYSKINFTLGGRLEKYWFIKDKSVMLAKRTSLSNEILNIREVISSKIFEKQGIVSSARYSYIYNRDYRIVGCKCNILSNESNEIVTAYDLLSEFGLNVTGRNSISDLVYCLRNYDAPEFVINSLFIMFLVDYLVTNRDRHLGNIAFLRDSEHLNIVNIAIFDNGSSERLEGELPEGSLNTTVNGIEDTEYKILCNLPRYCFNMLDLSLLPTNQWVKSQIDKAENLSNFRKEFLYNLYKEKKKVLRGLQKSDKSVSEYFSSLTDFNKYS